LAGEIHKKRYSIENLAEVVSAYNIPNSFLDGFNRADLPRQKHYFYILIGSISYLIKL